MWMRSLFTKRIKARSSSTGSKTGRPAGLGTLQLRFEPLEERTLLSVSPMDDPLDGVNPALVAIYEEYQTFVEEGAAAENAVAVLPFLAPGQSDLQVDLATATEPTPNDGSEKPQSDLEISHVDINRDLLTLQREYEAWDRIGEFTPSNPRLALDGDRVFIKCIMETGRVSLMEMKERVSHNKFTEIGMEVTEIYLHIHHRWSCVVTGSLPIDAIDDLALLSGDWSVGPEYREPSVDVKPPDLKLSPVDINRDLLALQREYEAWDRIGQFIPINPHFMLDGDRVFVEFFFFNFLSYPTTPSVCLDQLGSIGVELTSSGHGILTGWLPISAIDDVPPLPGSWFVWPEYRPQSGGTNPGDDLPPGDDDNPVWHPDPDGPRAQIDHGLRALQREYEAWDRTGEFTPGNPRIVLDGDRVLVEFSTNLTEAPSGNQFRAIGIKVTSVSGNIVSGWLPIDAIDEAALLRGVRSVWPEYHGPVFDEPEPGNMFPPPPADPPGEDLLPPTSQDNQAQRSDEVHTIEGFNGMGVAIGLFSDVVRDYATAGGYGMAELYGSTGDNILCGSTAEVLLRSNGVYYNRAKYFEEVFARVGQGGNDITDMYDSDGDDLLEADDNWAKLSSNDLVNFAIWFYDFDQVDAYSENGGTDTTDIGDPIFDLTLHGDWS